MATISRREILRDFRTRSVLEATRKIISREGFDAVTMERVAREAGITKGAIYLYFRNKQEMVLLAIEEIASEIVDAVERRMNSHALPWEKLCQLVRSQIEIMEQHGELLRALLLDRRLLSDSPAGEQTRRLLRFRKRHEANIKQILDEGVRKKTFHPVDTASAAFYINEMATSAVQKRVLGLSRLSREEETRALIRFLSLLLRKKSSARREERA